MLGWLIYDSSSAAYNIGYVNLYLEEAKKREIDLRLIFVESLDFGIRDGRPYLVYEKEETQIPDFAINRLIYPLLSEHLEAMGVKVFNNSRVSRICNDKARTCLEVSKAGVPMADTRFLKREYMPELLRGETFPKVMKTVNGHGGKQVSLLTEAPDPVPEMYTMDDSVLQPLIGSRHQDLRVYMIGKKVLAAALRTAREGFRSNYSLGGEAALYTLSEEEEQTIAKISDLFDFGLVGIDFIIGDDGKLIFNEIEDVVGSRMLYALTNINVAERYMDYILGEGMKQT